KDSYILIKYKLFVHKCVHAIKSRSQSYRPLVGFALLFFPIVFLFPTVNQPFNSINFPCLL
ncbi:hypothetical protein, partial [Bacteroides uniformis]|uniref:hypothetical protein n=1 Tax=Bacteroides uniformis TaxID=820 RepID=UPI001C37C863